MIFRKEVIPGWEPQEPVAWWEYAWQELEYYGRQSGTGEYSYSRWLGAWNLLRACLPHTDIDRGEDISFYTVVVLAVPTRKCSELELWTIELNATHYRNPDKWTYEFVKGIR